MVLYEKMLWASQLQRKTCQQCVRHWKKWRWYIKLYSNINYISEYNSFHSFIEAQTSTDIVSMIEKVISDIFYEWERNHLPLVIKWISVRPMICLQQERKIRQWITLTYMVYKITGESLNNHLCSSLFW